MSNNKIEEQTDQRPRAVQNGMSQEEYDTWIFLADKEAADQPYTYIIKQSDLTEFLAMRDAKQKEEWEKEAPKITGEASDGYHTFNELYDYRMRYNAALFNEWARQEKFDVHKSYYHSDGEPCFGGGWFVVVAELPTGQISNHYENKYWNLFDVEHRKTARKWDGHTPQQALERLAHLSSKEQGDES